MTQLLEKVMHVRRACVYGWGLSTPPQVNSSCTGTLIQATSRRTAANRVRSRGLITSAETSVKKVRKASQYMIYHLRMNSVTGPIDSNEKTVF